MCSMTPNMHIQSVQYDMTTTQQVIQKLNTFVGNNNVQRGIISYRTDELYC